MQEVSAVNEFGETCLISIPAERALTVYVDKRELVTLMTLGAHPELLVLGFLRNQRLVHSAQEIESITVDWDVGAAAVKTRQGISDIEARTAKKVVTTGCGQGSVFGDLMAEVDQLQLPPATLSQATLYGIVNAIRLQESTYKSAGSVHGCALFQGEQMLIFVEDVGRHNAIDTIAGWMWLQADGMRSDERDGDQECSDGRSDRGLTQWHHSDGAPVGAAAGPVHHRPCHESAFPVLQRDAPPSAAARVGQRAREPWIPGRGRE